MRSVVQGQVLQTFASHGLCCSWWLWVFATRSVLFGLEGIDVIWWGVEPIWLVFVWAVHRFDVSFYNFFQVEEKDYVIDVCHWPTALRVCGLSSSFSFWQWAPPFPFILDMSWPGKNTAPEGFVLQEMYHSPAGAHVRDGLNAVVPSA